MPQHVRGDNLGPVRLGHANGLEQAATATRTFEGSAQAAGARARGAATACCRRPNARARRSPMASGGA